MTTIPPFIRGLLLAAAALLTLDGLARAADPVKDAGPAAPGAAGVQGGGRGEPFRYLRVPGARKHGPAESRHRDHAVSLARRAQDARRRRGRARGTREALSRPRLRHGVRRYSRAGRVGQGRAPEGHRGPSARSAHRRRALFLGAQDPGGCAASDRGQRAQSAGSAIAALSRQRADGGSGRGADPQGRSDSRHRRPVADGERSSAVPWQHRARQSEYPGYQAVALDGEPELRQSVPGLRYVLGAVPALSREHQPGSRVRRQLRLGQFQKRAPALPLSRRLRQRRTHRGNGGGDREGADLRRAPRLFPQQVADDAAVALARHRLQALSADDRARIESGTQHTHYLYQSIARLCGNLVVRCAHRLGEHFYEDTVRVAFRTTPGPSRTSASSASRSISTSSWTARWWHTCRRACS